MQRLYVVPRGHVLTVTAGALPAHARQIEDPSVAQVVYSAATFGPYMLDRSFTVTGGTATVAEDSLVITDRVAAGAGAPVNAVRASVSLNPAGDENALKFTAREYGSVGNTIYVGYVDPGANDATIAVTVQNKVISVSLATGGGGAITSTAAQVKAAVEASVEAMRLVSVAIDPADSGGADDGSGVVTAMASTALTSGAGTGIGRSLPGGLYIDTSNSDLYRNDGTQAAPVWVKVGDAA